MTTDIATSDTGTSEPTRRAGMVLVRYGEIALKGRNRVDFENALIRNIRKAVMPISKVHAERRHGRLAIFPKSRVERVARRMQDVFGIYSISQAYLAESTPESIVEVGRDVLANALAERPPDVPIAFRVTSSRAEKRFPLTSTQLDRYVADRVMGDPRLRVSLKQPELELGIDVRPEGSYLFAEKLPGPGGLPVGTLGRAVCLLSGGLDSPVAAWLAMKRGCSVSYVTFHSPPYIGEPSKKKVVDVVRHLARFQPRNRLFVVPFTEVQLAVRDIAPEGYRTVLYRRFMQRIASKIARREKAYALVTGESVGQVASQTLENMTCIAAAAETLVFRPLVTNDKDETIRLARKIGTFELSSRPEPDCCTVFMPNKPVIRGRLEECVAIENDLDVPGLVQRALQGVEVIDVAPD